jgi:periplasmic divalent cation tolerance protein
VTSATEVVTVFVTAPDREAAVALARQVVEERIAACGNVIPNVTSVFRWNGKIKEEEEVLLILKTSEGRAEALVARIAELHSYDVPEILTLPVSGGSEAYLGWVGACTSVEIADGRTEV